MKLIHNCVRDTLLYLEENLKDDYTTINAKNIKIDYDYNDIRYTCKKLAEANFITIDTDLSNNVIVIKMTYFGHQFLDTIRDKNIWKKTLSVVSKYASVPLSIIQSVATSLILKGLGI